MSSRLLAGLTRPKGRSGQVSPDCFRTCLPSLFSLSLPPFRFALVRFVLSSFQMGNVLQYFRILSFAVSMVFASIISSGALFHILPVSLTKLSSIILFFPPSFILLLVVGLIVLSVSLSPPLSPSPNFIGKSGSLLAFQASRSFICADVWFTEIVFHYFRI